MEDGQQEPRWAAAHLSKPKRAQMARSIRRMGRHMGAAQFFSQSGVTT